MKKILSLIILIAVVFFLARFFKTGSLSQAAADLKSKTSEIAKGTTGAVGDVAGGAVDVVKKTGEVAGNVAGGAVDGVANVAKSAGDIVGGVAGGTVDGVANIAKAAGDAVDGVAGGANSVVSGAADGAKKVLNFLTPKVVKGSNGEEKIEVSKIYFRSGTASIDANSSGYINSIAKFIKTLDSYKKIRIEGHTDSSGNADSNMALSKSRAQAVVNSIAASGIDSGKLYAVGKGSSKPVASNDTADGKAKNRRVEFIIER